MEVLDLTCSYCGAPIQSTDVSNGVVECSYCHREFPVISFDADVTEKIQRVYEKRNRLQFEECEEYIDDLIVKYKNDEKNNTNILAELYFQKFLCDYGILYVDEDGNATHKPTLNRLSDRNCLEDSNLIQALNYAKGKQADNYRASAEELEDIRSLAYEKLSSEDPYDIFISLKVRTLDGKGYTADDKVAKDIYENLTAAGYRVFYSEETLKQKVGAEYEPIIYHALSTAPVFLLICTDEVDYITQPWVQNEWSRYLKRREEDPALALVPVITNKVDISQFPAKLKKLQALQYNPQFYNNLQAILKSAIQRNVGFKVKKKEIKVEIKPIQVVEKKIEKTILGGSKEKIVIPADEAVLLDSAKEKMRSMVTFTIKNKLKRAAEYRKSAEKTLRDLTAKNNKYYEAYWCLYLLYNGVADENSSTMGLSTTAFSLNEKTLNDVLGKCFSFAPEEYVKEKLNILKEQLKYSADSKQFVHVIPLYKFLLSYIDEKDELNITYSLQNAIVTHIAASNSKNNKYSNLVEDVDKMSDAIYDVLTIGGANKVIGYYDQVASAFRKVSKFDSSIKYQNKALELFQADPTALWNKLLVKFKISNNADLVKILDKPSEVNNTIEMMLKGGYKINNSKGNYVNTIVELCTKYLREKSKNAYLLFNNVLAILPNAKEYMDDDVFNDYYYTIVTDFAERNLWIGKFENAKELIGKLIALQLDTSETYWINLKAALHIKTNFGLLLLGENADYTTGKSEDEYNNIISMSQKEDEKNADLIKANRITSSQALNKDFHKVWQDIAIASIKYEKKNIIKTLKEIQKIHLTLFENTKEESFEFLASLSSGKYNGKKFDSLQYVFFDILSKYKTKISTATEQKSNNVIGRYKKKSMSSLSATYFKASSIVYAIFAIFASFAFTLLNFNHVNVGMANAYINLFIVIPLGIAWMIFSGNGIKAKVIPIIFTIIFAAIPFVYLFEDLMVQTDYKLIEYLPLAATILMGLVYLVSHPHIIKFRNPVNSVFAIAGIIVPIVLAVEFMMSKEDYMGLLYNFYYPGL